MVKRLISILLVVVLLIPLMFIEGIQEVHATNDPNLYNDNSDFKTLLKADIQALIDDRANSQLGQDIFLAVGSHPLTNANNLLVNVEMLLELGLVVYGSPSSVSNNIHVAMTQRTSPSINGYFRGGVMNALGEYRFLTGHAMTNQAFVPDSLATGTAFSERIWVYKPWDTITSHKIFGGNSESSPFFQMATDPGWDSQTRNLTTEWITRLVQDGHGNIGGGTISRSTLDGNSDPVNHIHVQQEPTMRHGAVGVMFHEGTTAGGKVWYQTLTGEANTMQGQTPVIATVTTDPNQDFTFEKNAQDVTFEVFVTGVIQDQLIFNNEGQRAIYQDRYDIKHWEFELQTSKGVVVEPITQPVANTRFAMKPTATQGFRVTVKSTEIGSGVVSLAGVARAVFWDNDSSQGKGQGIATLGSSGADFGSDFAVSRIITVSPIGNLTPKMIDYRDMSFGELSNYHIKVTHSTNTHNIHKPAPTESTLNAFNSDISTLLRDIIYGEIGNKTEGKFVFDIVQTVTQAGAGETSSFGQSITVTLDSHQPAIIEYEKLVQPDPQMPSKVFDLAPFPATDVTPAGIDSRVVKINGQVVDASLFFSGNFVFGTDFSDTWAFVEVIYTQTLNFGVPEANDPVWRLRGDENVNMPFSKFVWVVDTKPKAQFEVEGTFKENRLVTIADDTTRANYAEVMSVYPIHSWEWTIKDLDGMNKDLRIKGYPNGLVSQNHAWTGRAMTELLSKVTGTYEVSLTVKNNVEGTVRVSDPFIQQFHVLPDEIPALITNIWQSQITRNDKVDMYYHGVSVDNDTIVSETVRLYHDHNNNGVADHFISQGTIKQLRAITHSKLGTYKFTVEIIEEFGQPTIAEFVTASDRRRKLNEVVFWVENLRPLTEIYTDIPVYLPEIDVNLMTDQSLVTRTGANVWARPSVHYISSGIVDINNSLRLLNIRPEVSMRDLNTYVYETPASRTTTGSSRRSSSISYSTGGYSGTLSLFREDNIGYTESGTRTVSRTGTRTVTRTFTDTHTNSVWGAERRFDDGSTRGMGSGESSPAPSSKSVNSGGFSGSIPRVSTSGSSGSWRSVGSGSEGSRGYTDYFRSGTWTAHYSGSLSKQEDYTYTVQVPYSYWVPRWRGNYRGTIYKNVKQGFTPPFDSATASRYTIYISKNTINNMADVNQLLTTADTNFILIGSQAIKSQLPHVKFLEYGSKPIKDLVQEALQFIAGSNPYVSQLTTLAHIPTVRPEMAEFTQQGANFIVSHNDYEDERDPIIKEQWKITQDPNYFATTLGLEEGIQLNTWFTGVAPTQFSTTGKFTIQRRILDNPSSDLKFADYNYLSNEPAIEIFSHRRPIAVSAVNFTHVANGSYNITWADSSFDFDHIGRRADKGIIEHVVRYRKNMGSWFYGVPTILDAGEYVLEHKVKDVENTWSNVLVQTFELSTTGAIQRSMDVTLFVPEEVFVNEGFQASRFVKLDNTALASEVIRVRKIDGSWDVPNPRVIGLSLNRGFLTLDIGETHQTTATTSLDNETSQPVGSMASYSTSDSTVASVSATGLIRGVGLGTADILVEYQGIKKTMRVTVHPKPSSITVLPQSKTIKTGTFSTTQLTVMAHRASGFSSDITNLTSFTTNNPMAADVNSSGLVMAGGKEGTAVITARFEGFEAYFTITVEPADNPVPPVRPPRGGELFSLLSKTGEFASTQVFNESPTTLIETSKTFISSSVHSQQNVWQTLHRGTFFNPLFSLSNTGLYEVEYTATSTHGLSQTKIKQLRVIEKPIDMFARLKAQNPAFSTNSMPASENLVVYDAWTRHSETVSLEVSMLNTSGHTVVTPTRFWHNASDATDPNFPEDIWWRDLVYNIPATLADGNYTLRVTAVDHLGRKADRNFNVTVNTPINLVPNMPSPILTNDLATITAQTSIYTNSLAVELFEGTAHAVLLPMNSTIIGNSKHWTVDYIVPDTILEGDYMASFTARTPNNNVEVVQAPFRVEALKIDVIMTVGNTFMPRLNNFGNSNALAGDKIFFTIETEGYADWLELIVDPEIIAQYHKSEKWYTAVDHPIVLDVNENVFAKTDIMSYIVRVAVDETVEKDNILDTHGIRVREPYTFIVRAWRGSTFREIELLLDITGDVRQLLRPGIRRSRDN